MRIQAERKPGKWQVNMGDLLSVYENPGADDDADEQDELTPEERAILRSANPILDELLAEEADFIDEMWEALYPSEFYPEMHADH